MVKEKTTIMRADPNFHKDMKETAKIRFQRGLARFNQRDLGTAEMTKLLRRTQGFKMSLEELKVKPKKENVKR